MAGESQLYAGCMIVDLFTSVPEFRKARYNFQHIINTLLLDNSPIWQTGDAATKRGCVASNIIATYLAYMILQFDGTLLVVPNT